ncbi:MAG TPA: GNAT family N-acetyltransferase [Dyadobacter sp.]|jgi:hypothetical protein|nr:GNAT family N-acetyltransferase [Dyadobacter sp.]
MTDNNHTEQKIYTIISRDGVEKNKVNFDIFLYLTTDHLATQTNNPIFYYYLYRNNCVAPIAIFQCTYPDSGISVSAPSAPFGSIQCQDDVTRQETEFFLKSILTNLISSSAKELYINHYASCYSELHANVISEIFLSNGFQCSQTTVNHHITVSAQKFSQIIRPAERRRLKKCERSSLIAQLIPDPEPEVLYQFLSHCRALKGYRLPLNLSQLTTLFQKFPTQIRVFIVTLAENMLALSITIRVNNRILYNFLTDSLPEYQTYSPTVMLIDQIYQYCQLENIEILDLGTSLDQFGHKKQSLIRFKENIGGVASEKKSFYLKLDI